mgnify:CR=1 FL=1
MNKKAGLYLLLPLFFIIFLGGDSKNVFASEFNVFEQWQNDLEEVEKSLGKNQKEFDDAHLKITVSPRDIWFESTNQDSSLGKLSSSYRVRYTSIFTQYLTPQLRTLLYINSSYNFGSSASFSVSNLSLTGNIKAPQQNLNFSLGYYGIAQSPLTLWKNYRVDDINYYDKRDFKGVIFQNLQLSGIIMRSWFARRRNDPNDYFFGMTTNLKIIPSLDTELIYYNVHDYVFTSTLLGLKSNKTFNLDFMSNPIDLICEIDLSSNDEDRKDCYDTVIDKALLVNINTNFNLRKTIYPFDFKYVYIGHDYLKSARNNLTAILNAWHETYIYQPPEENPYVYDYYANQKGWRANLGPVKIGNIKASIIKEHYFETAPTKPEYHCRSFDHGGGEVTIDIPKIRTELIIEKHNYQTKRAKVLALIPNEIDVDLNNSCISLAYRISDAQKIQVGYETQKKAGTFNANLLDELVRSKVIKLIANNARTSIDTELKFSRISIITASYNETKAKIKLRTTLPKSYFYIIGNVSRNNLNGGNWNASLSLSHRISF